MQEIIINGMDYGFIPKNNYVFRGQKVTVRAKGSINFCKNGLWGKYPRDPDGRDEYGKTEPAPAGHPAPGPYFKRNSLILRIGNGAPIQAGSYTTFFADYDGYLYACNNDDDTKDNEGYWSATIEIKNPEIDLSPDRLVDIHCHLFTAETALNDLVLGLWFRKAAQKEGFMDDTQTVINWITKILVIVASDLKVNYSYEVSEANSSQIGKNKKLLMSPLMMDVLYYFENNHPGAGRSVSEYLRAPVPPDQKDLFINMAEKFKYDIIAELQSKERVPGQMQKIVEYVKTVFARIITNCTCSTESTENLHYVYFSYGFKKHMEELEGLYYENAARPIVFPFLAVDPRRPGILELVKNKVRKNVGPFWGVKLYPPLGYTPTHPNLFPVYEYCLANDIPITVHTAPGGLTKPNGTMWLKRKINGSVEEKPCQITDHENSAFLTASPREWFEVFRLFPNLKVNFAHFGGDAAIKAYVENTADKENWTDLIIQLMDCYPQVYADISYVVECFEEKYIGTLLRKHPVLKSRLLFGTDYFLVLKEASIDRLQTYFDQYKYLPQEMFLQNPFMFLFSMHSGTVAEAVDAVETAVQAGT